MTTTNESGIVLVLATGEEDVSFLLAAAGYAAASAYRLATSPSRIVKILNQERVAAVVARKLSNLGTTKSQLLQVLKLVRQHSAELLLTEQSLVMQDLNGAFEVFAALDELQGKAIRRGIERSPSRTGRPPVPFNEALAADMRSDGASWGVIAKTLRVSESTVRRRLHPSSVHGGLSDG